MDHQSPLGVTLGPYTRSKVDSEGAARARQDAGAPVAIVNPGAILGPHDPHLGESDEVVRDILRGRLPTWPRGRMQWVDVRDVAQVVVAALGRPGRRYLVPGESIALPHEALRTVTGRRLPAVRMPLKAALPVLAVGYNTGWPLASTRSGGFAGRRAWTPASTTRPRLTSSASAAGPWRSPCETPSAGWPKPVTSPPRQPDTVSKGRDRRRPRVRPPTSRRVGPTVATRCVLAPREATNLVGHERRVRGLPAIVFVRVSPSVISPLGAPWARPWGRPAGAEVRAAGAELADQQALPSAARP